MTVVTASQQVSWWTAHKFVEPLLLAVGSWPMVGSVEWCELSEEDPRKIAAIYDAARHWAYRVETCQQARAAASREVPEAANWAAIGQQIHQRNTFYAERPWLRRVSA